MQKGLVISDGSMRAYPDLCSSLLQSTRLFPLLGLWGAGQFSIKPCSDVSSYRARMQKGHFSHNSVPRETICKSPHGTARVTSACGLRSQAKTSLLGISGSEGAIEALLGNYIGLLLMASY